MDGMEVSRSMLAGAGVRTRIDVPSAGRFDRYTLKAAPKSSELIAWLWTDGSVPVLTDVETGTAWRAK